MADWKDVEEKLDLILSEPEHKWLDIIEKECKGDQKLKERVTSILKSVSESSDWLSDRSDLINEIADNFDTSNLSSDPLKPGQKIGEYRIKELIAEGGMGAVYLAKRADGEYQQDVAVKMIKDGMYSEVNIDRFRYERNVLASLNHPGIARLYHGGVTDDGKPYLIMEYVDGVPIDVYCNEHRLTVGERLELFKKVLDAVQYAHENLIIHRDLKPDNIFVAKNGDIKILDYGIAKMLNPESDGKVDLTRTLTVTPRYSSPEQLSEKSVTTSSDVYSLGVLLYYLIYGSYPLNFDNKSFFEIQETILYKEPELPKKKFSRLSDSVKAEICAERSSGIKKFHRFLSDDLSAIILKSLEKKPKNRYRTALSLKDDLELYEIGKPVSAKTTTVQYRLSKFLNRNRTKFTVAAAIVLAFTSITVLYITNINEEKRIAQLEADKATQIKDFMIDIFSANNPGSPNFANIDLTVSDALTAGVDKIENELDDRPEIYFELMYAIGKTLRNIEDYNQAYLVHNRLIDRTEEYYGKQSAEYVFSLGQMSDLMSRADSLSVSKELLEESLMILENLSDRSDKQRADMHGRYGQLLARFGNYSEAIEAYEFTDSLYVSAGLSKGEGRYNIRSSLADVHIQLRNYSEAEELLIEANDFYENYYDDFHINTLTNIGKLGNLYYRMGDNRKAEENLLTALEMRKEIYGEKSAFTAHSHSLLSLNYRVLDELEKALYHANRNAEISRELHGKESLSHANSLNNLGIIYRDLGNYSEAESVFRKSISIKELHLDRNSVSVAASLYGLADILYVTGDYSEARDLFKTVIEIDKSIYGETHAEIAINLHMLAVVKRDMGDYENAYRTFNEASIIFEDKFPETHFRVGRHYLQFGKYHELQGDMDVAKQNYQKALYIFLENFDDQHSLVITAKEKIASVEASLSS